MRDLGGGEAADRAQRERDLRRRRQRRVAAQEEQGRACRPVRRGRVASRRARVRRRRRRVVLAARRASSPRSSSISRRVATVVSHAARVVGTTLLGPLHARREQRLLHRVLAGVEVAVATHERAEDLRRELAQQVLGRRCRGSRRCPAPRASAAGPRPGRCRANGTRAAISSARSRLSTSMMSKLPRYSLASMYGPVGHHGRAVDQRHRLGQHLVGDAVGADELARRLELGLQRVGLGDHAARTPRAGSELHSSSLP